MQRNVLVSGCNSPLGLQICETLVKEGYSIIGTDISPSAEQDIIGHYFQADLSDVLELEELTKKINKEIPTLDGIVNNAAVTGDSLLPDLGAELLLQSCESFILTIKVNLLAPFVLSRDLSNKLVKSHNGAIVNIASIYGMVGNTKEIYDNGHIPTSAAYSASKGGLIQLTRYLSTYLAPKVRVNAIAPGGISRNQEKSFRDRYSAKVPMGRMAKETDVSEAVTFLVSPRSEYITGQIIAVDGGWTSK